VVAFGGAWHYNVFFMARPRKLVATERIVITGTRKLAVYLDDLIAEDGFGTSRAEVAKSLVWRTIEDLISKGILDRRRGAVDE